MTARAMTGMAIVALGIAAVRAAGGQTIRGVVTDSGGTPVPGVVVLMLDSTSTPAARTLTGDHGEFRVATPRPGAYRLHTLRIGFRPVTSDPITLPSGGEREERLVLTSVPVPLAAIRVEGKSSCRAIGDAATLTVWDQARTALTAAQLTASARAITATTVTYDRTMDAGFRRVLAETASVHTAFVTQPWRSLAPQRVRQIGYVTVEADGSTTYFAPGLDMLLSNLFVEDHCFRLVNASDKRRIGIAFQPTSEREQEGRVAEIRGTLWLDRASAELRSLEFRYVNVTPEQEANAGGAMEFVRMRNGTWAVSRWSIRMPELEQQMRSRAMGGTQVRLTSIKVSGGELALARHDADTLWMQPPIVLAGTVLDSASGAPAAGARVSLDGTILEDTADARGRFSISGALPGQYMIAVRTASLDSLGAAHQVPVTFVREDRPIELRIPAAAQAAAAICGNRPLDHPGILVGTVTARGAPGPAPGVKVVAEWTDSASATDAGRNRWIEVRPDSRGSYRVCGVPLGTLLTVRAESEHLGAAPAKVRITGGRTARADLVLDPRVSRGAVFVGAVLADSTQRPITGAEITLSEGSRSVLSNDAGEFRLGDVPPGEHRVLVRRLGYAPLDTTIVFAPNQTVDRRIMLRRVVALDSVSVTAERVTIASFEEHRARGFGHFLTREQLAKQEGRKMGDVLRELQTVNVVQGTGNRAWITSSRIGVQGREGSARVLDLADARAGAVAGLCYVRVWVDGAVAYRGRPAEPLFDVNSISPAQIEAVEYYSSQIQAPARYSGPESVCGVLVIWTRRSP